MAKNIVICSDGTGNTAVKGRGTNVFKLFEAIDLNGHRSDPRLTAQLAFYDDGVGTESFKPLKLFAGATGFGLGRNVRQLYKELCRVYDPGDRIFLFGFSRGAFTVRTLAGLIGACGILDMEPLRTARTLEVTVNRAYRAYRKRYRTGLGTLLFGKPATNAIDAFRRAHALKTEVPIAFLGVWDTVDAVGLPFRLGDLINTAVYRFKFPDRQLGAGVQRACQALAVDDERCAFEPLLWDADAGGDRITQVWFTGAHSNVGGGYPKQGLSLVALDWMMAKASGAGLRFLPADRALYRRHANVDDKLYDPRAGLGALYRWKPRDIASISRRHHVQPVIHLGVLERIAHGTEDYAPGNLAPHATVVFTPTGNEEKDAALEERARDAESVLRLAHPGGHPLLATVAMPLKIGRISYHLCLLSCVMALVAAAGQGWSLKVDPRVWAIDTRHLVANLASSPVSAAAEMVGRLGARLGLVSALAASFLLSYLMALFAGARLSATFSLFWHGAQQDLRRALKRARLLAAQARSIDHDREEVSRAS